MTFFISLISFLIFPNSFSKSPFVFYFVFVLCCCLSSYMLEILPVLFLLYIFLYISPFQLLYHFIYVIVSCASLSFEKQTIACFFCPVCTSFVLMILTVPNSSVIFFSSCLSLFSSNILFCFVLYQRRSMFFHLLFLFDWFFLYHFLQFLFLLTLYLPSL